MNPRTALIASQILLSFINATADSVPNGSVQHTEINPDGSRTTYLSQPKPSKGGFEVKMEDKNGKITQWYQTFQDSDGKEIINVARVLPNPSIHTYASIQIISTYRYNADRNICETYQFYGDGTLFKHIIYTYDQKGNWVSGDVYNALGKQIGIELTPPTAHMYESQDVR